MDLIQTSLLVSVLLAWVLPMGRGCEPGEIRKGCRIENGDCYCASGCPSEYRYSDREECRKALRGKNTDSCSRTPCLHSGVCSQITKHPGYKCKCQGTKYYGTRCEIPCPKIIEENELHLVDCVLV